MNITMQEAAKAWGEGKAVEWASIKTFHTTAWHALGTEGFCFNNHIQYRIKPEITTSLSDKELQEIFDVGYKQVALPGVLSRYVGFRAVADAVIKQYIKDTEK